MYGDVLSKLRVHRSRQYDNRLDYSGTEYFLRKYFVIK